MPEKEKKEKKEKLVDVSVGNKIPVLDRNTEYVSWHGEKRKVIGFAEGQQESEKNEIAIICQDKKKQIFTIFL